MLCIPVTLKLRDSLSKFNLFTSNYIAPNWKCMFQHRALLSFQKTQIVIFHIKASEIAEN